MVNNEIPEFIVIDDDDVSNFLCKKVIKNVYPNAYVTIFSDAAEALEYLETGIIKAPRAIVFLDINMPVMSSWDFIKSYKLLDMEIKERLMVYILSSSVDPLDKVRSASSMNIYNYIAKPLTSQAVENTVSKLREEVASAFAREIHDVLGQQLIRIKMDTSWLSSKIKMPDDLIKERIKDALRLVDDTIETVRGINKGLRPRIIDDLGLFAAIRSQANDFVRYSGIPCIVTIDMKEPECSRLISDNVYRIVQESLTNINKHAEATEVSVSIGYEGVDMKLTVADNGKGFDSRLQKKGSFGLLGIKERAAIINGTVNVKSELGSGTTVQLTFPIII